jgi:flagellin
VQQFLAIEASLDQGVQNLQDGQSLLQTAEGALQGTSEALIRMRELGMQAQNGTLGDADRATIQAEYDQLSAEVTRISESTGFNGRKLLDGSLQGAGAVHLADGTGGASIEIAVGGQSADDLGLAALDLGDPTALSQIDRAIDAVSSTRGRLGAVDNRLESQLSTLQVAAENTAAARSRIGDADLAVETSNLTRGRIQEDAQVALLVQGRRLQSVSVLKLLS